MKKMTVIVLVLFCSVFSFGQSQEIQQLVLDIEKLAQLKAMYSSMLQGYNTLRNGYGEVINIKKADFNLHKTNLDALLLVSSPVKRYSKINSIIANQALLSAEYKEASKQYFSSGLLTQGELTSLQTSAKDCIGRSLKLIDELLLVVTPGSLRMNDEERISAIDRIDKDMYSRLTSIRKLIGDNRQLVILRRQSKMDIEAMRQLQGLK
jgi:hypothetical protein